MGCSLRERCFHGRFCAGLLVFALVAFPLPVRSQDAQRKLLQEPPPQQVPQTQPQEAAQVLTIDHKQVGCVVAERFPVISARIGPTVSLGRARVYFRAAAAPHWYFVEMKAQGDQYVAALPKPKKSTTKIEYYVEAMSVAFAPSRTAEYAPDVVPPPGACRKGDALLAVALTSAKPVVGAAAGAPAVPVGFSAVGVVPSASAGGATAGASSAGGTGTVIGPGGAAGGGAGGGISTGLLVGVLAAGAAVAAVAAASGGSKNTSSSTPAATQPTPPTTAPPPTLTSCTSPGLTVGTPQGGAAVSGVVLVRCDLIPTTYSCPGMFMDFGFCPWPNDACINNTTARSAATFFARSLNGPSYTTNWNSSLVPQGNYWILCAFSKDGKELYSAVAGSAVAVH
jgi:hypothetical protein